MADFQLLADETEAHEGHDAGGPIVTTLRRQVEVWKGQRFKAGVREAYGPEDWLFAADTIDRSMRAGYLQTPIAFRSTQEGGIRSLYETIGYRRDSISFETGKEFELYGTKVLPEVPRGGSYTSEQAADAQYTLTMRKYGHTWPLPWESWIRDKADLGLLASWPKSWGMSCAYTREYLFTAAWAANLTFFSSGNGNYTSGGGGALSRTTLETGINIIRTGQTDQAGNEIPYLGTIYLIVPPALYSTAFELVKSERYAGSSATTKYGEANALYNAVVVVENPFLSSTTGWYLFTDPRMDRPAVRYGYLRGYEQPDILMRAADVRTLSGAAVDDFVGAFENDSIAFKVRMMFGVDVRDPRGAYYAAGA